MRISTLLAFLMGLAVFALAAITSSKDPWIYINGHAALVVFGGTVAAAAISFGFRRLLILLNVFVRRLLFGKRNFDPRQLIEEMMVCSEIYRTQPMRLTEQLSRSEDFFLKEALELVAENFLPPDDIVRLLTTRTLSIYDRYMEDAVKFKALAKFPPAFGLMGAVMGMIGIMSELGDGAAGATVGKGLALALVGTLYGVALANLLILPLAENLMDSAREIRAKNALITEAIHLLLQKKNPILMSEELNSFLLANERIDWKKSAARQTKAAS